MNTISEYWKVVLNIIRSIGFKDIVDIVVVALLIYGVIRIVRESRVGQLVKGLVFLIVAFAVSEWWGLTMLNGILSYFFQYAFVALLIVFQPEIRRALESIGRSNWGNRILSLFGLRRADDEVVRNTQRAIDAVVEGTAILQKMRMGALIIFERSTNLSDIAATGTMINSGASGQLIGNIFFNKAPLHDGAMIIREGKILSAGCILPLSKSEYINAALGTRHRAALGMSEDSDAVVVVVSEETAQISIAVSGNLTRNYNAETLHNALTELLLPEESSEGSSFNLISKIRGSK